MNLQTEKMATTESAATTKKQNIILKTDVIVSNFNTDIPENIDKKHWNEWIESGVSPDIIKLNLCTIYDSLEVDKLLNRNNKRRWKHSDNLIPCWSVTGVDPLTEEPTLLGCQVKPDTPLLNKNGKLQKYINASECNTAPLFLKTNVSNYWVSIIEDKSKPVIITEGAKKAGAGITIGYPVISIPGVSTCRKNGKLHDLLKLFAGFGRVFYLCFDNDVIYKRAVQNAMLGLARELSASGSKVMVIELPPGEAKGMDDFISQNGKEEFDKLVEKAETIEEWRKKVEEQWQQQQLADAEEHTSKLLRRFELVKQGWGENIALNTLKNSIELAGQPLNIDQIRLYLSMEFKEDIPIGDARMIVDFLAEQNAYNPVVQYLDQLAEQYPDVDTSILDNLATRYFGSSEPMHNKYMKMHVIAAVARARKPGCRHDCATIIVGKQGARKSTFWQVLYGDDWFSDELGDANEKDELAKLHRFWCLEWSEFETVYKRKDIGALKKFMTSRIDTYRTPYSVHPKDYPRASVLVGTTNETEILSDPTGSRRFWIIPSQVDKIPIDLLSIERDRIWAAANALFMAGEKWYFTDKEDEDRQEFLNRDFQVKDPWEERVKAFIQYRDYVTVEEVLTKLDIEVARQDIGAARRLSNILRRLGWRLGRKRIDGKPERVWVPDSCLSEPTEAVVSFVQNNDLNQENQKQNSLGFLSGSDGSPGSDDEIPLQNSILNDHLTKTTHTEADHPLAITETVLQPIKNEGDPSDPLKNPKLLEKVEKSFDGSDPSFVNNTSYCDNSVTAAKNSTSVNDVELPLPVKVIYNSPIGEIKAIAEPITPNDWEFSLMLSDSTEVVLTQQSKTTAKKASGKLKEIKDNWVKSLTFRVHRIEGLQYHWIEGCRCIEIRPHYNPMSVAFIFECPDGKIVQKLAKDSGEFEVIRS